jgi:hypothetical protein
VVVGQNEAGGSLAPGCWPAYDKQTASNSAFQLTLAKVGCVADDEPLLNQRQDNEFWNWKPNLAESKKTDAVEMDVPCTRNGSNVTAKLIMRTTIACHRCHEPLKAMTSLSEPLTCLETLVSILKLLTVFLLVKLTLYVVLIPSPVVLIPSPVLLIG